MYSRILVPVDLDNVDKLTKALDLAGKTAKLNSATVVFVSVADAVPTMSAHTEAEQMAVGLERFIETQADTYGIRVSDRVVLRGDLNLNIGKDIIKAATDAKCDLIVMASHVPGLKEHVLASNAGYVASHAPMTVYVVR